MRAETVRRLAVVASAVIASVGAISEAAAQNTAPATSPAQAATLVVRGLDGREHTVSPADLARLTRHDATVSAHQVRGRYSGVALREVLALAGATPPSDSMRGRALSTYVVVEASDGYRVLFTLAELDPGFTDRVVILADRVNGQPLPASEGPYRVIVPGEKRPARWARQVVRISLGRPN
ncbi:MAG TPA: molybdopterin-dependent oxidoreductase [Gemmatimonadaceae bacterium]|nr:molybdopterin-dependent oxidoreductase [Gemmatimonadaceae bacterium]